MSKCRACGWPRDEFPEVEHPSDEDCTGPECTCYEIHGLAHMMGCPFYNSGSVKSEAGNG